MNPKAAGKNERSGDSRKDGFNERWRTRQKQNASFSAAVTGLVELRNARSVWTIGSHAFPGAHFATFPPELARRCILAGCPVGGTVLDPFTGTGTTALVALRNDRAFIGIELSPAYAEMARERIEGDMPLFNRCEVVA